MCIQSNTPPTHTNAKLLDDAVRKKRLLRDHFMDMSAYWSLRSQRFLLTAAPLSDLWDVLWDQQKMNRLVHLSGVCEPICTASFPSAWSIVHLSRRVTWERNTTATHVLVRRKSQISWESLCGGKRGSCLYYNESQLIERLHGDTCTNFLNHFTALSSWFSHCSSSLSWSLQSHIISSICLFPPSPRPLANSSCYPSAL